MHHLNALVGVSVGNEYVNRDQYLHIKQVIVGLAQHLFSFFCIQKTSKLLLLSAKCSLQRRSISPRCTPFATKLKSILIIRNSPLFEILTSDPFKLDIVARKPVFGASG